MVGCQWISRIAPGSISTRAAAIVFVAGKLVESVMRTCPPGQRIGSCASMGWLKVWGTAPAGECTSSEAIGPGTSPANTYRVCSMSTGRFEKAASGTPKFCARTSRGMCANRW